MTVLVGEEARLPCLHNSSLPNGSPNVTWWRILQGNFTWPPQYYGLGQGDMGELTISSVNKSHRGLYRCHVQENRTEMRSCGTYLRVRGECGPTARPLGTAGLLSGQGDRASACITASSLPVPPR